jgi:ectoine hydroxylase-related dioxygenase (phytanoyl-CoA dioxygenase family)
MARSPAGNTIEAGLAEHWSREGYIVVRGIYEENRVARLKALCEYILEQWRIENPEKGEPGGGPDSHVMRHLNHPGYFHDKPDGRAEILEAAAAPSVLETVAEIFGEQPRFRCTSLFFNPLETSQDGNWHRDSQFCSKNDAEEQAMMKDRAYPATGVQLQIALEPSDDVEFVPRSHLRWDTPEEYHIRKADDFANNRSSSMPGAVRIALEPGDALAFNPMGLHRGRYHVDRLRRTLMLTYRSSSSAPVFDYFSDQPWFLQDGYLDGLSPCAKEFYRAYISTYKPDWQTRSEARPVLLDLPDHPE